MQLIPFLESSMRRLQRSETRRPNWKRYKVLWFVHDPVQQVIKTTQNIIGTNLHLKVLYVTFRNVLLLVTPVAVN